MLREYGYIMKKETKAIGIVASGMLLCLGLSLGVPSSALAAENGGVAVPSAGVGQILEANVAEEEYLAAAEEAKNERKDVYKRQETESRFMKALLPA